MKPQDQIKALAELDGFFTCICPRDSTDECCPVCVAEMDKEENWSKIPYLISRDIIVSLIESQDVAIKSEIFKYLLTRQQKHFCPDVSSHICMAIYILELPASQLAEALLRATGKWVD